MRHMIVVSIGMLAACGMKSSTEPNASNVYGQGTPAPQAPEVTARQSDLERARNAGVIGSIEASDGGASWGHGARSTPEAGSAAPAPVDPPVPPRAGSNTVAWASAGDPTVSGGLDKEVVRYRVVSFGMAHVAKCYGKAHDEHRAFQGTINAAFTIGSNGRVSGLKAVGTPTSAAMASLETCVANAIRRIEFPKPVGGAVNVVYPFRFEHG